MNEPRTTERRTLFDARTGDLVFTFAGWWIRLIWGVTFKPQRFRWRKFYGYRLFALRLWQVGDVPLDGRLIGIQWRRARA